jgi:hypothetical protein
MAKKITKYRSEIAGAVHEGVRGMHRLGLVDKKTMREFDVRCLTAVDKLTAKDIQKLRKREGCESAWNKDPVFGVIGIQSGPRGSGSTMASMIHGGRDWDAYCGDDCEDPPGVFRAREVDQGDLP